MKRTFKKFIVLFTILSIMVCSTLWGNYKVTGAEKNVTETVYNGDGFSVKYIIQSQWNNEYIANVIITNTGKEMIENWELSYESVDEYSNIWNAEVSYHSARNYNVKNAGHNQNIRPGESVSFGFQASFTNHKIDVPVSYKLLGDKLLVNNKECKVTFDIQNQWNAD